MICITLSHYELFQLILTGILIYVTWKYRNNKK